MRVLGRVGSVVRVQARDRRIVSVQGRLGSVGPVQGGSPCIVRVPGRGTIVRVPTQLAIVRRCEEIRGSRAETVGGQGARCSTQTDPRWNAVLDVLVRCDREVMVAS